MNTMHLSALLLIRLSVGYESVIGRRSSTLRQSILRLADGEQSTVSARNMLAAVQMTSTNDKIANLQTTIHLVERAAKNGAIFVSLPECSSFIGGGVSDGILSKDCPIDAAAAAETLDGVYASKLCELASTQNIWLSVGGFPEKIIEESAATQEDGSGDTSPEASNIRQAKVYNTHFLISPLGVITNVYRKIHLFDSPMAGLMESKSTEAGSTLEVADCGFARVGLTTCYDLRFPELYGALCRPLESEISTSTVEDSIDALSVRGFGLGAEIVLVPSAFTVATGTAHWEVLLRARAIENQCYIVAAAQTGQRNVATAASDAAIASRGNNCVLPPFLLHRFDNFRYFFSSRAQDATTLTAKVMGGH